MTERFNFYDVYGYLIPGFVLIGFLWLPFGVLLGKWPSMSFGDALGGLVAAYVVGHVLATVATAAFPSGRLVPPNDIHLPSEDVLDKGRGLNPADFIDQVTKKIEEVLKIKLTVVPSSRDEARLLSMNTFLRCRDLLVLHGRGAYVEQFQGMYSMMRALAATSLIAAYYFLGWLLASASVRFVFDLTSPQMVFGIAAALVIASTALGRIGLKKVGGWWLRWRLSLKSIRDTTLLATCMLALAYTISRPGWPGVLTMAVGVALVAADHWLNGSRRDLGKKIGWPRLVFESIALAAFYGGFRLSWGHAAVSTHPYVLIAITTAAAFLAGRCYASYEKFEEVFANTVYRSFLHLSLKKEDGSQ